MLKATGHICSVKWDGSDYTLANVINVAMHVPVAVGDTVVTSGINTVFPPLTPIGIVHSVEKDTEEIFQTITVRLSADFASIDHVYVVQNRYASEKDSLERVSQPDGGLMPE
jgi:rod shape-determining protein MreC